MYVLYVLDISSCPLGTSIKYPGCESQGAFPVQKSIAGLISTRANTNSMTNVITPKTSVAELVDLTNDIFEAEDQKFLSKYFSPLNNSQLDGNEKRSGMICIPTKNVDTEILKYLVDKSVVYITDKPALNAVTTPPNKNLGDDGEVTRIKRRRLVDDVDALEAIDTTPSTSMKSGSVEAVEMGMQHGVEVS